MNPHRLLLFLAAWSMLLPGCTPVEWRPEHATLLFTSNHGGNPDIYCIEAADTSWVNLTQDPAGDNWPVWSPDGMRIAFQSRRSGNLDIWLMNADGSNPVQLTHHEEPDYLPSWTPDGHSISFTSWRMESGDTVRTPHFYIMQADGSGIRRLIEESPGTSAGVEWSPDGTRLVYTRKTTTGGALVVAETNGWRALQITDGADYCGAAVFSPDGHAIACYAESDTSSDIVIMNADGSGRVAVVRGGWNYYPHWSPDGRWILYCARVGDGSDDDYDLFAVAIGGEPVRVAGGPGRQLEGSWKGGR